MPIDRFLIGYTDGNSGLTTDSKPWLIPDNAFANLENAYVFRGRVRKRMGSVLLSDDPKSSRVRYQVAVIDGSGNATGTVPGVVYAVGQQFSINEDLFTVNALGTPATLLSTNPTITMTYNTSTGAFTVAGATASSILYFYPATPIMGSDLFYSVATNRRINITFDTQFSYFFDTINNSFVAITGPNSVWTGTDADFFWMTNYQGSNAATNLFWVTNFVQADGIRYFDGTSWTKPTIAYNGAGDKILTCRIIIQFQNRLLFLKTVEEVGGVPKLFFNRIRYSWLGDPLNANAFNQELPVGGNFLDAPVQQAIIAAEFIKNRLIIYFEDATLELAYTGNETQPFVFQRINAELGATSTFSEIPFDKEVLGIDNIGIHACNGANVDRIDGKIPQLPFSINNTEDGRQRVFGIRDYYSEMAYWTFPNQDRTSTVYFPNKMLIYNYVNNTWAINDDSITCFGYFLRTDITPGARWGTTYTPWENLTMQWNAGTYAQANTQFRTIVMGNQQGFVYALQQDVTSNAPVLQITDVVSYSDGNMTVICMNHNLSLNDFVLLYNMNGLVFSDGVVNLPTAMAQVVSNNLAVAASPHTLSLRLLCMNPNADEFPLIPTKISGTYTGGGLAARVSQMNILTKQYNFYTGEVRNIYISKINFLVDRTTNGLIAVDFLNSSSENVSVSDGPGSKYLETSAYDLVNFEKFQSRLWHPLYFHAQGQCVQFSLNMTALFMYKYTFNSNGSLEYVALQDFQLHAMAIFAQKTSIRMQ